MSAEDLSLPKATVTKIIKDHLPQDMRMSGDFVDYILKCCTEFVDLVSSEANSVAEKAKKAMMQPEHVLAALEELDFHGYLDEVRCMWDQFKEESKADKKARGATSSHGLSEDELAEIQRQMFQEARQRSIKMDSSSQQMQEAFGKAAAAFNSGSGQAQMTAMPE